jgi:hypothetical protein
MAPCNWVINRDFFQDTKVAVSVQTSFDIMLPMEWYLTRGVDCNRSGIVLNKDAEGWGAIHEG